MDLRRSCGISVMYWDAARTRSSLVRWYWCKPGARPLPFPHVFSSEIWDPVHWFNPGAGEPAELPQLYDKGAPPNPFPSGLHHCGSADYWLGAAPSNYVPLPVSANGLAECCREPGDYNEDYSDAYEVWEY